MHLRSQSVASQSTGMYFWALVYQATLGLGSCINYNPLLRIEINDIGFVFYAGMGLLAMCGAPLDGRVNAAGANWYRRSRNDGNEPYARAHISLLADKRTIRNSPITAKILNGCQDNWPASH